MCVVTFQGEIVDKMPIGAVYLGKTWIEGDGGGEFNWKCSACSFMLVHNMGIDQIRNGVIECPFCGSLNLLHIGEILERTTNQAG